jgi:hypothetical protein
VSGIPGGGTLINLSGGGTIINEPTGSYVDRSGIGYDMDKHNRMPPGWFECEGYKEQASFNDASGTRVFEGPWGSRLAFRQWALGSVWIDAGDGKTLHRDIPAQDPEMPWLYATDCELVLGQGVSIVNPNVVAPQPDGNGNPVPLGKIAYTDGSGLVSDSLSCRLAVHYHVMDFDILSDAQLGGTAALSTGGYTSQPSVDGTALTELDRYVVKTSVDSLQGLPIPGQQLFFVTGPFTGQAIPSSALTKLFPCEELTYTWKNIPLIPQAGIDACMGMSNQGTFDPNSRLRPGGYPNSTLICMAPQKVPRRTSQGLWVFDLVAKFIYKPGGVNFFPAADGNLYGASFSSGALLFPVADFNKMFKFG